MDYLSRDMGPVVRMARPEKPNEIDEFVNPLCTELDEIGSFQSYCIGHFEQEWVDGLGQMIAEGRVPITDAPRVDDPTELRHMDIGYIHKIEFSRLVRGHFYAVPSYNEANGLEKMRSFVDAATINRKIDLERT